MTSHTPMKDHPQIQSEEMFHQSGHPLSAAARSGAMVTQREQPFLNASSHYSKDCHQQPGEIKKDNTTLQIHPSLSLSAQRTPHHSLPRPSSQVVTTHRPPNATTRGSVPLIASLATRRLSNAPDTTCRPPQSLDFTFDHHKHSTSSPRNKSKELFMTKSEVLQVKQLAEELTDHGNCQVQRLKAQVVRLANHALALDEVRCAGLLSSKRKIETLNDYIHSLTLTKQSSSSRLELQSSEIDLLKRQAIALSQKVSCSPITSRNLSTASPRSAKKRMTDENDERTLDRRTHPYQRGSLESQNGLLLLEKKHLETKLEQAEAQIQQLSKEFKKFRALLIARPDMSPVISTRRSDLNALASDHPVPILEPDSHLSNSRQILMGMSPNPNERSRPNSSSYKRRTTMGDAEAEHLLLASKRLTSISRSRAAARSLMNSYQLSPSNKLSSQGCCDPLRSKMAGSSSMLAERRLSEPAGTSASNPIDLPSDSQPINQVLVGDPSTDKHDSHVDEDEEEQVLEKMIVPNRLTFTTQHHHSTSKERKTSTSPNNIEKRAGLMDDLLAAAETVLTRNSSPIFELAPTRPIEEDECRELTEKPEAIRKANCSRPASCPTTINFRRADGIASSTITTGLKKYSSGLDVLADQAFATSSQKHHSALSPGSMSSSSLSPCSVTRTYTPPSPHRGYSSELSDVGPDDELKTAEYRQDDIEPSLAKPNRGRKRVNTDEEVNTIGPVKKTRSPYVKWNSLEDELLVKAVSKYGQRWDAVSKCIPSRSYHQCRQRWLRGLKAGENLPDGLQDYYPAIQVALQVYQLSRKRSMNSQQDYNLDKPRKPSFDDLNRTNEQLRSNCVEFEEDDGLSSTDERNDQILIEGEKNTQEERSV